MNNDLNEKIVSSLPEYARDEINTLLLSKERYHNESTLENIQQMKIDYHNAYTAIKHCVVSGIIRRADMDELIEVLRRY